MPDAEESPEYQAGIHLGESIVKIFRAIAAIDGITFEEAVEQWIGAYVAERIIDATGEADASPG